MGKRQQVFQRNLQEILELQARCLAGDDNYCRYLFGARQRLRQDLEGRAAFPAVLCGVGVWMATVVVASLLFGDFSYSWWSEGFTLASIAIAGLVGWSVHRVFLARLIERYSEYLRES